MLLNFWGEWCAPCLDELPALLATRKDRADDELFMIGMLYTDNLEAAQALIDERGISWPQVHVKDDLIEQFKVNSYPTNILIFPDGRRYLKTGQVSTAFFDRNMK